MAITAKKGGTFAAAFMFKGGRIYAGGFTSEDDAQIWELQARKQLKAGVPVTYPDTFNNLPADKLSKETVSKWLDKTYHAFWSDKSEPQKARQKMNAINDFFGRNVDINDIDMLFIDDWVLSLKNANNSNGTINRKLAALSKMLTYAHDSGALIRKPKINRQAEPKGRVRWLTEDEEAQCLETMRLWSLDDLKDATITLLDTGMRKGELLRVEARDVQHGMLNIWDTKSGIARSVPLTKRVKEALSARISSAKSTDKLFNIGPDELARQWDRVRYHLEYTDVTIHVFRHTTASRLVQRGIPLKTVQEWMGHETIQTTMRYAHLSPKNLADALAVLE